MMLSNMLPMLGKHADKMCLINSIYTTQFNHHPGQLMMQTGHNLQGYPAMGSWLEYGLGSEDKDFPGYVVMNSSGAFSGGETLWNSGFLPSTYSGVTFRPTGDPILNLNVPEGFTREAERRRARQPFAAERAAQGAGDGSADRRAHRELRAGFRMQSEAPDHRRPSR